MTQTPDNLRAIIGIGYAREEQLHTANITTFKQLAQATIADIHTATNAHPTEIHQWQTDAQQRMERTN